MKSVTNYRKSPSSKKYPYLGIFLYEQLIVLFSEPGKGTVVASGKSAYPIGTYKTSWTEDNADEFVGEVTLSNN